MGALCALWRLSPKEDSISLNGQMSECIGNCKQIDTNLGLNQEENIYYKNYIA